MEGKLSKALAQRENARDLNKSRIKMWMEGYGIFLHLFVTVLREGLETVVYVGGVGLGLPATSFLSQLYVGFSLELSSATLFISKTWSTNLLALLLTRPKLGALILFMITGAEKKPLCRSF